MTYKACLVDSVFFCRWLELDGAEHTFLLYETERLAKETPSGRLAAMIVVVPEDIPMPDEKFRRAGIHSTRAVFDYVDQLMVVIEGHGMRGNVMRAAASTMAMMAGVGSKAHADDTLEAALKRVKDKLTLPLKTVLARAALQGIVSSAPP